MDLGLNHPDPPNDSAAFDGFIDRETSHAARVATPYLRKISLALIFVDVHVGAVSEGNGAEEIRVLCAGSGDFSSARAVPAVQWMRTIPARIVFWRRKGVGLGSVAAVQLVGFAIRILRHLPGQRLEGVVAATPINIGQVGTAGRTGKQLRAPWR